jgi:phospholipid/cholesterol/gamma-HCH transport system substrate-binding protein
MKISNETKVGALTALAITLLILGFNFLKGKSLFKTGNFIYVKFADSKGLKVSNPVAIKGYQVGAIYELEQSSKNLDSIIIAIKLNKEVNIPVNSIATIKENPLGENSLVIGLGDGREYIKNHDTLRHTTESPGMLDQVSNQIKPVMDQMKATINTLDSAIKNINSIFDPATRMNLQQVVLNTNRLTTSLATSSASLQQMLNTETGSLAKSLDNVNAFTRNLAGNNDRINGTLTNLQNTTDNLAKADINGAIGQLKQTVERLHASVEKLDSKDGSIGKLLNDTQVYDNIANTTRSLNILMDDIRVNPKRYVSISVFGGKSKGQYLTSPLPVTDTTVKR